MVQKSQVAIIGAGPAGIASAIYLHRAGRAPLLLEQGEPGGLLRNANLVENYPGFPGGIKGPDLVHQFKKQLDMLGIRITRTKVESVEALRGSFRIVATSGTFSANSLIIATGTRAKSLSLPGSAKLAGERIFTEIVDMPLSQIPGKRVVIIGGGDAAFDYGLNLAERGADVRIVSRSEPDCISLLRARADASGIDIIVGSTANRIRKVQDEVSVRCRSDKGGVELLADYVLIACGREPNIDILSESLRRRIGSRERIPDTRVPGLFMAGDVVRGIHRQTAIAVGDGVRAGMMADEFLRKAEASR